MTEVWGEIGGRKPGRGCFKVGGGHAGRGHEEDVHGGLFRLVQHVLDAGSAHDVGYFMGVRGDEGGAPGNSRLGKAFRGPHGGLDVNVAVAKPRG